MGHQIQRLQAAHFEMVELVLAGHTNASIAQVLNRTPESVSLVVNAPMFQEEVSRRRAEKNKSTDQATGIGLAETERILEEQSVFAATKLGHLLNSKDEKIQQTSAVAILQQTFGRQKALNAGAALGGIVVIASDKLALLERALSEDPRSGSNTSNDQNLIDGELVGSLPDGGSEIGSGAEEQAA